MEDANTIAIVVGVIVGIVLIYGLYKLISWKFFSAHTSLRSGTRSDNGQQVAKALMAVIGAIALIAALFFAWEYFT